MSDEPRLFLLGQTLSELVVKDPKYLLPILCGKWIAGPKGEEGLQEEWKKLLRADLIRDAANLDAPRRVAVISSAGLGKSTNLGFVEAHVCEEQGGKQLPFLIRLDRTEKRDEPSHIGALQDAIKNPKELLAWLALRVDLAVGGDKERHRWAVERYAAAGRITLLFDGLDHVMELDKERFLSGLAALLNAPPWRNCPIWISGRREAFEVWGEAFFRGHPLRVLQVDPLGADEIDRFMRNKTRFPWQHDFPRECQPLLATPRTLGLICFTLQTEIPHPRADQQTRQDDIRKLELHTAAGIYHRAYFHVGDPRSIDNHGLLAQGLLSDKEKFGLEEDEPPLEDNLPDRVSRMGLVLGAIAFHMLAKGAEGITLSALRRDVGPKLEKMGHGSTGQFVKHLNQLRRMDNHTLEFSLFNSNLSTGQLSWAKRTVKAFFAAYWVTRYGCIKEDLPKLKEWIVDKHGNRLAAYDEFWQFAAEMPDRALSAEDERFNRWVQVFRPSFTPPAQLTGSHDYVQWHRRMVYHSFELMRKRSPGILTHWREKSPEQLAIVAEIEGGWCDIALGDCYYQAEPAEGRAGRLIKNVPAFRMHEWPVINRWYEAFHPAHLASRWKNPWNDKVHPLANVDGREGEEFCPVVNVTWLDAWNYAAWVRDHLFLPSELQWEHACRKGTAWDHYFEGGREELAKRAWFDRNAGGHTHPMPPKDSDRHLNPNGLYDMHGNVWEWCADWYDETALHRAVRGGSWDDVIRACRSASRFHGDPTNRPHNTGFRLATALCTVGAE
jgi:hypothetical protein